jgi:hypothetical protein
VIAELLRDITNGVPALRGALCKANPDLFDIADGHDRRSIDRAAAICAQCGAFEACADWVDGLPKSLRPSGVVAMRFIPAPKVRPLAEPRPRPPSKADKATAWLSDYMRRHEGLAVSTEVRSAALSAGYSIHVLKVARQRLGVELERIGGGFRIWSLAVAATNVSRKDQTP